MIIDLCYIWGEKWRAIYDEGNDCWGVVMIITSIALYIGTGLIMYKNWILFVKDKSCPDLQTFIIIGGVLIVL